MGGPSRFMLIIVEWVAVIRSTDQQLFFFFPFLLLLLLLVLVENFLQPYAKKQGLLHYYCGIFLFQRENSTRLFAAFELVKKPPRCKAFPSNTRNPSYYYAPLDTAVLLSDIFLKLLKASGEGFF
jgi:hypothetical protein